MAFTSGDMRDNNRRPVKVGGQIKITYEMMASILGLPESCQVTNIESEHNRDIATIKFSANEIKRGLSYHVGEGMEYPTIDPHKFALKRMIKFAQQFNAEIDQDTPAGRMYREALREIIEEESNE